MRTKFGIVTSFNPANGTGQIRPDNDRRLLPFNQNENHVLLPGATEPYFGGAQRPPVRVKKGDRVAFREGPTPTRGSLVTKFALQTSFLKIAGSIRPRETVTA